MNLLFVLQFRRGVIFFFWADAKGSGEGERTERSPFLAAEMYLPAFSSHRRENPSLICTDETSLSGGYHSTGCKAEHDQLLFHPSIPQSRTYSIPYRFPHPPVLGKVPSLLSLWYFTNTYMFFPSVPKSRLYHTDIQKTPFPTTEANLLLFWLFSSTVIQIPLLVLLPIIPKPCDNVLTGHL